MYKYSSRFYKYAARKSGFHLSTKKNKEEYSLTISFFVPLHYARRRQTIIEKFVSAICQQIHYSGAAICYLDRVVR